MSLIASALAEKRPPVLSAGDAISGIYITFKSIAKENPDFELFV